MRISLKDMQEMLELEMFTVFPSFIDYTIAYCEYDRRYSRTHVAKQWYDCIKKTFPQSLDQSFGFRMKSWDTFQYWVKPEYKVFGEFTRAERERKVLIKFLTDWMAHSGNVEIDV